MGVKDLVVEDLMMELYFENSQRLLAGFFFSQITSKMFKWVLNTSLNKNKFFYIRVFGI